VLARNADAKLVVHLGDAANVSCTNEFHRFAKVMLEQRLPWVMAPGNHDSLMMGNFSRQSLEGPFWEDECASRRGIEAPDEHMDKNEFLEQYFAAKGWLAALPPGYDQTASCVESSFSGDLDRGIHLRRTDRDPDDMFTNNIALTERGLRRKGIRSMGISDQHDIARP
jgi:hypothetical protein